MLTNINIWIHIFLDYIIEDTDYEEDLDDSMEDPDYEPEKTEDSDDMLKDCAESQIKHPWVSSIRCRCN